MEQKTFNLKMSAIQKYHAALAKYHDKRGIVMPFKESVQRTFDSLDSVVAEARAIVAAIPSPGEDATDVERQAYQDAILTVLNSKADITAHRLKKDSAPRGMTPREFGELSFMFSDY